MLRILQAALVNLIILLQWPLHALALRLRKNKPVPPWVYLRVRGDLRRRGLKPERKLLRGSRRPFSVPSVEWLERVRRRLVQDPTLKGVVIDLEPLSCGLDVCLELRDELQAFRAAGKEVIVHLGGGGNKEYLVASVADRIQLDPGCVLELIGLSMTGMFFGETLEKAGLEFEVLAAGDYKSFGETFTRTGMSEANREALESVLDDLDGRFVGAIAEGRGVELEQARAWIDGGPWVPAEAKDAGVCDLVGTLEELESALRKDANFGEDDDPVTSIGGWQASRPLKPRWRDMRPWAPVVGLIELHGNIQDGPSSPSTSGGSTVGDETVVEAIERAASSKRVKALVVDIDSRGGSASASEKIWRALREAAEEKPIIACFGGVAASGGYYIGSASKKIFASDATITGSIGVISGHVVAQGLLAKLGIHAESLRRGAHATYQSPTEPLSESARERLQTVIMAYYGLFKQRVAEGRGITPDEVEPHAQGRIWTGAQARERGLVDAQGTLRDAIREAWQSAGMIPKDAIPVRVFDHGPRGLSLQALMRSQLALPAEPSMLRYVLRAAQDLDIGDGPQAFCPIRLEVE